MDKDRKARAKAKAEKKAEKAKQDDGIKRTGKVIHIVSKRQPTQED